MYPLPENSSRTLSSDSDIHTVLLLIGSNFSMGELVEFCDEKGIRLDIASVAHPQANGQVERTNGLILQGL